MTFKTYIARQGQLWDQIALEMYGTEMKASFLLEHNQEMTDILIFLVGYKVRIPIIQDSALITALPPCLR